MKKLVPCLFLFYANCATLNDSVHQAKAQCSAMFRSMDMPLTEKDKWNKREYVRCVSVMTDAGENYRVAQGVTSIGLLISLIIIAGDIRDMIK